MKTLVRSLRDVEEPLKQLQEKIKYQFKDYNLLVQAMTHPSFSIEQPKCESDNQRLEFLGDTIWQLCLTDAIYKYFPDWDEGKLTKIRSSLSRSNFLANSAKELGIPQCLLLGKGECSGGGLERESNLEDAFEALMGAIYLDCHDLKTLQRICQLIISEKLPMGEQLLFEENPKGLLQEFLQKHFRTLPIYTLVQSCGPAHNPEFTIQVQLGEDGEILATSIASNRKKAEHIAAANALIYLKQKKSENEQ